MNPLKTSCFAFFFALLTVNVAAQILYFYPPDDDKWVAGNSYISRGIAATSEPLTADPTKCGWYKITIPSGSSLRDFSQFWLEANGIDRIGPNGIWSRDFEPTDDFSLVGGVFRLGDIFAHFNNPASLYFVADELDPFDPWAGWYTVNPVYYDPWRCNFEPNPFYYDLEKQINTMCVQTSNGKDLCGTQLINGGYSVDFYMVNRVTRDTVYLSPARGTQRRYEGCTGTTNFKCNGDYGITVTNAVYTCGGRGQCRGNPDATARVGITGRYNVYARLMDTQTGKQVVGSRPLLIDSFIGESNVRVVWGKLIGMNSGKSLELKDAYGNNATQRQEVAAGKRAPVYVSTGAWNDANFTSFEYDDDPDVAGGTQYTLIIAGGSGLKIYRSKTATDPIGTTTASRVIPASGIDTLWVEGTTEGEFSLNTTAESLSTPSMKLTVSQPTPNITIHNPASNIRARVNANAILLENLPANAKVELYNLQGKRIYSTTSHSPLATSHLKIEVQTKGMYIVKIGSNNILRVSVM